MSPTQNAPQPCSTCGTLLAVYGCPECNGFGYKSGWFSNQTCPVCSGAGHIAKCPNESNHHLAVHIPNNPFSQKQTPNSKFVFHGKPNIVPNFSQRTCSACGGSGKKKSKDWKESLFQEIVTGTGCPKCNGKGWIV